MGIVKMHYKSPKPYPVKMSLHVYVNDKLQKPTAKAKLHNNMLKLNNNNWQSGTYMSYTALYESWLQEKSAKD